MAPATRARRRLFTTIAFIVPLFLYGGSSSSRIPLHTNENIAAKLDGPMTFGYGIDAIDVARKINAAVQTSTPHAERERS
ncbi:hypothetical protein [Bradyrhizobium sp. Cp5.3]|uniref:hypothetical protein n=1 Tax=Bradyrhizobium sp. Cp5.3 TaxID=443598 RepID=UPI0012EC87A1|nr:hypothetical protein [Bradyrhizobium sp. Cp5.3]